MKVALLYLLGITAAEILLYFVEPLLGALCHVIVLVALIVQSLWFTRGLSRRFLFTLALVPLYKLMGVFVSEVAFASDADSDLVFFAVVNPLLLTAAVVMVRIMRLEARQVGIAFGKPLPQLLIGLTGIAFGWALYYMIEPEPLIAELEWGKFIVSAFVILLGAGAEELTFRGILQRTSTKALGYWGLLYVSLLFAFIHVGRVSGMNLSVASIPFILAVALFFSWIVKKTGSLVGVILSHFITNVLLFLVVPLVF